MRTGPYLLLRDETQPALHWKLGHELFDGLVVQVDALWDLDGFDFSDSLFLTEGQVDKAIPVREDCKYVLHNCDLTKYQGIIKNALNIQVYTHDCHKRSVEKINEYTWFQPLPVLSQDGIDHCVNNRTLYQPWATNLLPGEFPIVSVNDLRSRRSNTTYWVGSICDGHQGNLVELQAFAAASQIQGAPFVHLKIHDNEQHVQAIQISHTAPAVQGHWQVDKGYIPCRVFKNISYGRVPMTNSLTISRLFKGYDIPYESTDMNALISSGLDVEDNITQEHLEALMDHVRTEHTYMNRVRNILRVL